MTSPSPDFISPSLSQLHSSLLRIRPQKQFALYRQRRIDQKVAQLLTQQHYLPYYKNLHQSQCQLFETIQELKVRGKPIFLISEHFQFEMPEPQPQPEPEVEVQEEMQEEVADQAEAESQDKQPEPQPQKSSHPNLPLPVAQFDPLFPTLLPLPSQTQLEHLQTTPNKQDKNDGKQKKVFMQKQCKCCGKVVKKHTCQHTRCDKPCAEGERQLKARLQKADYASRKREEKKRKRERENEEKVEGENENEEGENKEEGEQEEREEGLQKDGEEDREKMEVEEPRQKQENQGEQQIEAWRKGWKDSQNKEIEQEMLMDSDE